MSCFRHALTALALLLFCGNLAAQTTRVRLVAANLTSGNNQSYDEGHGMRILQGLAPDVVFIQEFKYGDNTSTAIGKFVTQTFGAGFSFFRESIAGDESGGPIPNGVISRYPIDAMGEIQDQASNRDIAWAKIDLPGDRYLWAFSVHLLTNDGARNAEATNLVAEIGKLHIPAADFLAIGGDFNADTRTGTTREAFFDTLGAVVNTTGPYPVDQAGDPDTNSNRGKPYDGVYVDGDLGAFATGVLIAGQTFTNGLVFDSRVFTPLSGVSPVQMGDSGAFQMQHMAVVRDFLIPVPEPGAGLLLLAGVFGFVLRRRR